MNIRLKYLFLFLCIIIILFTGCINEEASKLIDSSITTGNLLSEYYDNLIKFTIQTWELEAFNSSLREIEFSQEDQKEYQKTIEHLEARKKLVNSFVKIFPLLEEFVNNKSPEDIKGAAVKLGNNINELKPLKDNKIIMPSDVFGNLSEDILNLYKFFEIKYICKSLVKTLEKIKELFEAESELYTSIIQERNNKSLIVINYMIDNELVIPWSLIESAPGTVGLTMAVAKKPAKNEKTKKALKKVLEAKYYRMNYLIKSAENDLITLLLDLIKTYNEFIQGKKVAFDNIGYIANRVGGYFNDISVYVNTIRNRDNYNYEPDIIYHGNTKTKIFHQPNCVYYNSMNSTDIFYNREDAINDGYRPCETCNP